MMEIFKRISDLLAKGEDLVAAVIVSRSGSAPRSVGTRMVVRRDGAIIGTIGGGALEARVRDIAGVVFKEKKTVLEMFTLTDRDAGRMGMVCGGEVEVLAHFVDASDDAQARLYREALESVDSRKRAWLITELPSATEGGEEGLRQHVLGSGGSSAGCAGKEVFHELISRVGASRAEVVVHGEGRCLVECLRHRGVVYIFGAGHVSQKLAPLAGLVGFSTVVLDDRAEFANRERFEDVDEIIVLGSYERALDGLDIDEDSYLVLVTRGHAQDKTVLGRVLRTSAGYIGMIGSGRKRKEIYEALCREGFSSSEFDRVHSPIGIDIGAETPEEIAVSIVAELIQARAGRKR